ncbi:MAG: Hsp33 family molecular chaperone HslO [Myxococcota bacterium]|nr:Hsp33 family molecular chaperone HslO [Myxococcota bacterium]
MATEPTDNPLEDGSGGVLVRAIGGAQTIRLIAADTSGMVETLRTTHDCGPLGTMAIGRVASAAILLSATLKDRQQIGFQINGDGPLREAYAIADAGGRVRATISSPRAEPTGDELKVGSGFGQGRLSVTRQLTDEAPYRGIVQLVTGEVAEDLAHYLHTSEQIPSAVSLGEILDSSGVVAAGGLLVQALPGAEDSVLGPLIERIESLPPISEYFAGGGTPTALVSGLMDDVEILEKRAVNFVCPCTREQFARRLCTIGEDELRKLTESLEETVVECHFCRTEYTFDKEQIGALLYGARMYDEAD